MRSIYKLSRLFTGRAWTDAKLFENMQAPDKLARLALWSAETSDVCSSEEFQLCIASCEGRHGFLVSYSAVIDASLFNHCDAYHDKLKDRLFIRTSKNVFELQIYNDHDGTSVYRLSPVELTKSNVLLCSLSDKYTEPFKP